MQISAYALAYWEMNKRKPNGGEIWMSKRWIYLMGINLKNPTQIVLHQL